MIIIPAIDIRQGKCVMLTQGKLAHETIYSTDPVFVAKLWQAKGAKKIHLIDLDGAFCGIVQNWDIIKKIRQEVTIEIQFGGGVRHMETICELNKIGIDKIILGTVIVYNPKLFKQAVDKYGDKILSSIDLVDKKVAIAGWKEITSVTFNELVDRIQKLGLKEIIVTDTKKNGTLTGVNIEFIKEILSLTKLNVMVSGGISSIKDIEILKKLNTKNLVGVIIGKALYTEDIKFEEAVKIL